MLALNKAKTFYSKLSSILKLANPAGWFPEVGGEGGKRVKWGGFLRGVGWRKKGGMG